MFMSKLDDYIVSIALPVIASHFDINTDQASRIILVYLIAITSTLLIIGKIGDRFGFKLVTMSGFVIFTISSALCGFATSPNELIIFRLFQGIGASILLVMSQAIIGYYIPPGPLRGKAFSFLVAASALGMTMGPTIGGIITQYLSWNWIFWVNIPAGIIAVALILLYLPDDSSKGKETNYKKTPFDITGSFFIFISLSSLVFALNMAKEMGWGSHIIIISFIIFVLFFVLFIIRQIKCSYPLIEVSIFKNYNFTLGVLANNIAFMLIAGNLFLIPFYLRLIKLLDPAKSGLLLMIYPLFFMITTVCVSKIIDKYSHRTLVFVGLAIASSGWLLFAFSLRIEDIHYVILYMALMGAGFGLFFSPNERYLMDLVPKEKAGEASGIIRNSNNLGMVMGICIFELIYAHSIPAHSTGLKNTSLELVKAMPGFQLTGFHYVYITGACLCVIALILASAIRNNPAKIQSQEAKDEPANN